jgi:hypothetical protein
MKQHIHFLKLLFALLLLPAFSIAQQYYPFPEENATWTEQNFYLESFPPVSWTSIYNPEQDTVIQNIRYRIVYEYTLNSTSFDTIRKEYAYFRQDTLSKKVYIIREYLNENVERLLMDYSVQKGDTVILDAYYWELFPNETDSLYIIDSVANIELFNGETRKIFYLSNHGSFYPIKLTNIEGIGSIGFPFGPTSNWVNKLSHQSGEICCPDSLLCLYVKNQYVYVNNNISRCGKLEVWTDIQSTVNDLQCYIFPNPTHDQVNISFNTIYNDHIVSVINLYGKKIMSVQVNHGNLLVDLSSYPAGVYFVNVNSQKIFKTFKLIKK